MTIRDEISAAHARIAPWLRRTPVMDVRLPGIEQPVTLKLEYLQMAGVFKARGAFNSLVGNEAARTAGVAAASGGNHGAAVACAAQALGLKARIFVPSISSPAKVARIRSYGAEVVQDGAVFAEAQALCEAHVAETGAVQIHPYDAPATIAGQGTLAVELEQQAPKLDTVLVAVGGGGLIAGVAGWYENRVRTVSVEPETSCALHAAHAAGEPVKVDVSGIAADSLGASTIGTLPFEIASRHVSDYLLVSDDAIDKAQHWLWDNCRIMAEPGACAVMAALLDGVYKPASGEKVCAIICGANVDPAKFAIKP
jgi:threonine dehydratase